MDFSRRCQFFLKNKNLLFSRKKMHRIKKKCITGFDGGCDISHFLKLKISTTEMTSSSLSYTNSRFTYMKNRVIQARLIFAQVFAETTEFDQSVKQIFIARSASCANDCAAVGTRSMRPLPGTGAVNRAWAVVHNSDDSTITQDDTATNIFDRKIYFLQSKENKKNTRNLTNTKKVHDPRTKRNSRVTFIELSVC